MNVTSRDQAMTVWNYWFFLHICQYVTCICNIIGQNKSLKHCKTSLYSFIHCPQTNSKNTCATLLNISEYIYIHCTRCFNLFTTSFLSQCNIFITLLNIYMPFYSLIHFSQNNSTCFSHCLACHHITYYTYTPIN